MENFKIKCRKCEGVLELGEETVTCGCGNCTLGIKDNRMTIGCKTGVSGYTVIHDDEEYILLPKTNIE